MATKTQKTGGTVTGKMLQEKLARAIEGLDKEQAERLVKLGAKIDRPDENGWTILHHLCSGPSLKSKAVPAKMTAAGERSLGAIASSFGLASVLTETDRLEKIKFVVEELDADFNARTNDGDTPLSLAVSNDLNSEIVDFLMEAGAELVVVDDEDETEVSEAGETGEAVPEETAGEDIVSSEKAYCVECKRSTLIRNPQAVEMSNGRPALKGQCDRCGTAVYKILASKK